MRSIYDLFSMPATVFVFSLVKMSFLFYRGNGKCRNLFEMSTIVIIDRSVTVVGFLIVISLDNLTFYLFYLF